MKNQDDTPGIRWQSQRRDCEVIGGASVGLERKPRGKQSNCGG
jgi:hypothetical protein